MRSFARPVALLFGSSLAVAAFACGGADTPPPVAPSTQVAAPITTVVIDAGPAVAALGDAAPAPVATPMMTTMATTASAGDAGAAPSGPDFTSCNTDGDCVAVPRAGCCHNGHKEAVNTQSVDAYKTSVVCDKKHHMCPQYIVLDQRVARCAPDTKKCVMVQPTP